MLAQVGYVDRMKGLQEEQFYYDRGMVTVW